MNKSRYQLLFFMAVPVVLVTAVIAAFLTMGDRPPVVQYLVIAPLAYLLGSIPFGYVLLQWRLGVDIRDYGSGRTGVSNVLRTAGGKIATLVMALDLGKGVLAVLMAREIIGTTSAEVTVGLLALMGHNWPVFLKFQGGRGIATGLGVLTVMAPIPAAIGTAAFIPITLISRYLSLGSILGVIISALSLVALTLVGFYSTTYALYGILGAAIIIWQHRDNIQRIRDGNERRLGTPATKVS